VYRKSLREDISLNKLVQRAMEKDPRVKAGLFSSGYASALDVDVSHANLLFASAKEPKE
jgi:hypothetical protein